MAKISMDQISTNSGSNDGYVGFFSLANDGDEATVRIMHDSTDTFDLVTTHQIQLNNKYRRVNCIRDPRDPIENCPLCAADKKIQQRMYVHLIQYEKDENGNINPVAKVWERSASYAITIKNLITEYGPLSDYLFKIRRNGAKGSMDTTYDIILANPKVYREELYPRVDNAFDNYSAVGSAVLDKSFDELAEFVATGEFPQKNNEQQTKVQEPVKVQAEEFEDRPSTPQQTFTPAPQGTTRQAPWENQNTNPGVSKPTRYY